MHDACNPLGHWYPEGARVLAFLERDETTSGADWRPAGTGQALFFLIDGEPYPALNMLYTPRLSEAREAVASFPGLHQPQPESRICDQLEAGEQPTIYAGMADRIVIGKFGASSGHTIAFTVEEDLAGGGERTLTLSNQWLAPGDGCKAPGIFAEVFEGEVRERWSAGERALLFIVPRTEDWLAGDWRPAEFGLAAYGIAGDYLYPGPLSTPAAGYAGKPPGDGGQPCPSLPHRRGTRRRPVARGRGLAPTENARPAMAPRDEGGGADVAPWLVGGAGVLVVVAGGASVFVWRRARHADH